MENRLSKVLAALGVASRRACESLIAEGVVTVNGKKVLKPETFVSLPSDILCVRGKKVTGVPEKKYFILNKPKGYICSNVRTGRKKLVVDLFESLGTRLFTVGRLDRDTTGLLLVTNDGHFANKVIHPSSNLQKEYIVKVFQEVTDEHLKAIGKGTLIEGVWIKPKKVLKMRKGTIKIVVKEGKKREVRLLVQNAGMTVRSLHRVRIGGLRLGEIEEGTFREMTDTEMRVIFE